MSQIVLLLGRELTLTRSGAFGVCLPSVGKDPTFGNCKISRVSLPSVSASGEKEYLVPAGGLLPCLGHQLAGVLGLLHRNKLAALLDAEPKTHAVRIDIQSLAGSLAFSMTDNSVSAP